jgi:hypothetical protein
MGFEHAWAVFAQGQLRKQFIWSTSLWPAYSGGLKGLTFRVAQLPGLIRALQQAQAGAVERGLIDKPVGQWRAPEKQRAQPGLTWQ